MTMTLVTSAAAAPCRRMLFAATAASLVALAGCAAGPNANPRDPFEPFNRKMMEFNEHLDSIALKPAATAYRNVVPPLVRTGVNNFFSNLGDAWSGVNSLLQLHVGDAGENILRFSFNTVFGFAGVLDIASELNIERHKEDFGQTLGRWGVPSGPYLMLPFFGPSTVRDALALPIDRRGDPVNYVNDWDARWSLYVLRAIDQRANLLRVTSVLGEAALDKYSFTRDAYLQRRRAEVDEGKEPHANDGSLPKLPGQHPSPSRGGASDGYVPPDPDAAPGGSSDGYIPPAPEETAPAPK
jgi:phospholipid-binding lipoprotein MlaA